MKTRIFEQVIYENAVRNRIDHDFVLIHDPQPHPLIHHYSKKQPWIWRCHIDLSHPHAETWQYLRQYIGRYDAMIVSRPQYRQRLSLPQLVFPPVINPFNTKNRPMSEAEIDERLAHYSIPTDLPQKSLREGFGLTVSEAMWKGTPVIGGKVGGICDQIADGVNGYLVSSVEEAAHRIVQLLQDDDLRRRLGTQAHRTVQERFLLTRYFEQYLDLFGSFETVFRLRSDRYSD